MLSADSFNAIFETLAFFFICLSSYKLYHDKKVRGIHWSQITLYSIWGAWNLWFYPAVGAWYSFFAGIGVFVANMTYLAMMAYYIYQETHLPSGRRGIKDWCETYTGQQFWLLDPDSEAVDPRDIAHHLAYICRYNGATANQVNASNDHYSVAEHCCLLSDYAYHVLGRSAQDALSALVHDASEAYSGDIPRPWKNAVPILKDLETELDRVVIPALGGEAEKPAWLDEIDLRILVDERKQARNPTDHDWALGNLEPLGVTLKFWTPESAEYEWLSRYRYLTRVIGLGQEVT